MPIVCSQCGAQMPDNSVFCPACGRNSSPPAPVRDEAPVLNDKLVGVIAYFTFIPPVVLLLIEPFKNNRFIRFHAFQSIFLTIAALALWLAVRLAFVVFALIPVIGHLLTLLFAMIFTLGLFVLWILLLVKVLQGEKFKLPLIGDLAERQTDLV